MWIVLLQNKKQLQKQWRNTRNSPSASDCCQCKYSCTRWIFANWWHSSVRRSSSLWEIYINLHNSNSEEPIPRKKSRQTSKFSDRINHLSFHAACIRSLPPTAFCHDTSQLGNFFFLKANNSDCAEVRAARVLLILSVLYLCEEYCCYSLCRTCVIFSGYLGTLRPLSTPCVRSQKNTCRSGERCVLSAWNQF